MSPSHESSGYGYETPKKVGHMRLVISLMILSVLALLFILYFTGLIRVFRVASGSMEPTLQIGDRILVDGGGAYDRFDIVTFLHPLTEDPTVKRIIGLSGDEIRIEGGILYINGEEQFSPFIKGNRIAWGDVKVKVPEDRVFVLGDNRNDSEDSLNFGPLKEERITGVLRFILWPVGHFGPVKRIDELEEEMMDEGG